MTTPIAPRIDSEIGRLRHVVTHRPGRELERLTPSNIHRLLFDDVPWAGRAREEHDAFVDVLASRGAVVAGMLIGGILKSDLGPIGSMGLRWQSADDDDLVLPPLPNTLFQRDNAAWIGGGVSVNPMAFIDSDS